VEVTSVLRHLELDFNDDRNEEIKIICPFHDDSKPSLSINRETGKWHCFGCKRGGSLYRLARLLGKNLPSNVETDDYFKGEEEPIPLITASVSSDCVLLSSLKANHPARIYMAQTRGFKLSTIKLYQLMYRPKNGTIVFPLFSLDGDQITYQERYVKEKGWLNPPRGYEPTTQTFFGLSQVKNWQTILLVEGPFDVMRLHEWNYQSLSLQGTHFSDAQAKIIKEVNPHKLLWCMDNDEAGKGCVVNGVKKLRKLGLNIAQYYVELPEGRDPDDMRTEEVGGISVFSWKVAMARRIK
jgi:DNA primase